MRKIILSILGLLIVAGAVYLSQVLAGMKEEPVPVEQKVVNSVFAEVVKNSTSPVTLTASGSLSARDRVDLFAEVQGIFESSANTFKPGSYFTKGQTLLKINSDEFRANIRAQKASLYSQIVGFLPDLRLDYADAFPKWQEYVRNFDESKPLLELPKTTSEKEKLFITGKGIYTTFYNISNLEERLDKYIISAPFSGVLTDALVNPGALVSPGQRLGQLINTGIYELEVNVNVEYMDLLKVGRSVNLHNLENTKNWKGKVARVNGKVDQASQTIGVFIQVSGKDLKEGMYLEADLEAKQVADTYEIDRQLLLDNDQVFVIDGEKLAVADIAPVFFKENSVIVKGLSDGTQILAKPIPGAYAGMRVKIIK
ncbi:MAG: HlyD family efflux transporter periplasmic adaptor subunit [Bacteroidota bacterium]